MRGNSPTPTNGNVKLINLKQGNMVKFMIALKGLSGHLLVFDEILRRKNKQNTFVVLQCCTSNIVIAYLNCPGSRKVFNAQLIIKMINK